ncbi:MAG TPA: hypothetical protein GXZ58_01375 [Bacilli bacterium]|nr:hypothetical protein [Bacilli bacterium]
MKYLYWLIISALIFWEIGQLKAIFKFSTFWQYAIIIGLIGYFAYLLDLKFTLNLPKKITDRSNLNNEQ